VLCFSVASPLSLWSVLRNWGVAVQHHRSGFVPRLCVALQCDLRPTCRHAVPAEMGYVAAHILGCVKYFEWSREEANIPELIPAAAIHVCRLPTHGAWMKLRVGPPPSSERDALAMLTATLSPCVLPRRLLPLPTAIHADHGADTGALPAAAPHRSPPEGVVPDAGAPAVHSTTCAEPASCKPAAAAEVEESRDDYFSHPLLEELDEGCVHTDSGSDSDTDLSSDADAFL